MTEKQIEKSILQYLNMIGYAVKVQSGMIPQEYNGKQRLIRMAERGTADIFFLMHGKLICIEVKKDKKEVEKWIRYPYGAKGNILKRDERVEAQKETMKRIQANGGLYIIASSIDEVQDDLRQLGLI